ncbi:MAG: ATP-binding protein [Treponema sp.]|nr:ATP-binding protein [Treponema sp.]
MAKSKRNIISSLKAWVKRYQITVINASVTIILIGIIISVLLSQLVTLQRKTVEENVVNMAGVTATEIQSFYTAYVDIGRTLSQIMRNDYYIERRQEFFDDLMDGLINSNRALVNIFTVWRPRIIEEENETETVNSNKLITGFSRERGFVEKRSFEELKSILNIEDDNINTIRDYLDNINRDIIGEPRLLSVGFKDTWVIDVQILVYQMTRVIGVAGVTINIDQLQQIVESRELYEAGQTMVSSNNGIIVAHYNADFRGISLKNPEDKNPLNITESHDTVFQEIQKSMDGQSLAIIPTSDTLVVSYPLVAINTGMAIYFMSETSIPPWAVITTVPISSIMAPLSQLFRFSIIFVIGAGIMTALTIFLTSRSLTQRAKFLQHDLERATTMQDNLKYGLFLMDEKFIIQRAYSKALENILSISNLQGKNFVALLSSSVKASEQKGIADYFEMIIGSSFDKEMLEDINPIRDFIYTSIETGETKSLRSNFSLAEWGRGTSFILGTLEDITAEKDLENQIKNIENQREQEMRSLFQVIQLNPRVLSDFIEDADYEFDHINKILKNKDNVHKEILIVMFQAVHAIKSNALILNLDDISGRLHKLEASIKALQEKPEDTLLFDDFLSLVLELNEVMKEKDKLKTIILKIENFRSLSGKEKSQKEYVLVETLTKVCDKAQTQLHKKARLIVDEINNTVLDYGPRRIIKEVLTQLIRNAVYHGIEMPEERVAAGKDETGDIRLSVRFINNEIIIKLTDNGKGIDFNKIQQIAEAKNLLSGSTNGNKNNDLIRTLFMPGFSTIDDADYQAGRGIGLSMVRDRVKDLHGNIKVSTVPGKGTAFVITIPMETAVAAKAS